jgi:predicted MFS family arabinose efflux permease
MLGQERRIGHDVRVRFLALLWGWKMRAFTIAAVIAVLAVPASAQNIPILGGDGGHGKLGKKATSK